MPWKRGEYLSKRDEFNNNEQNLAKSKLNARSVSYVDDNFEQNSPQNNRVNFWNIIDFTNEKTSPKQ